jgi:hypothetical protein
MKVLFIGDCERDHVIHWYESVSRGLREAFDTRMFGKGYPSYDPSLTTYNQIINHIFPGETPDLLLMWGLYGPTAEDCEPNFPYQGILDVAVPKAMFVTDFWYYTEKYPAQLEACIERGGLDFVFATFRSLCDFYRNDRFGDRFRHVPFCFDSGVFKDWRESKVHDVGFFGAGVNSFDPFYPERLAFHQSLKRHAEARGLNYIHHPHPGYGHLGQDHPMVGAHFSRLINRCRIHVVTGGKYHLPFAKIHETMASGTLLLATEPEGAAELGLVDGETYVKVRADNLLEMVDHYLANPEEAQAIVDRALISAHSRHSSLARAHQIRNLVLAPKVPSTPEPRTPVTEAERKKLGSLYQDGDFQGIVSCIGERGADPSNPGWDGGLSFLLGQAHGHLGDQPAARRAFAAELTPCPEAPLDPAEFGPFSSDQEMFDLLAMPGSTNLHLPVLYTLVLGLRARRIVDLGIGGTTRALRHAARHTRGVVLSCDYDVARFHSLLAHQTEQWKLELCPSSEFLERLPGPIDFAVHDAAHDYRQVQADLQHLIPKMRTYGMIAIHDTHEPEFQTELIAALLDSSEGQNISFTTMPYACGLTLVRIEQSAFAPHLPGEYLRDGATPNTMPFPHPLCLKGSEAEAQRNAAFLFEPDWTDPDWKDVLLSYLQAFEPGEPVLLMLHTDAQLRPDPTPEEIQGLVLEQAQRAGKTSFPDIALLDSPAECLSVMRNFDSVQWVPRDSGSVTGLHGSLGQRLALARQQRSLGA